MIKSRRMKCVGHEAQMEGKRNVILMGNPKGKRPLGRRRCRIEHIKILGEGSDIQLDRHRQITKMHTDR
jgi:hypothetical protein